MSISNLYPMRALVALFYAINVCSLFFRIKIPNDPNAASSGRCSPGGTGGGVQFNSKYCGPFLNPDSNGAAGAAANAPVCGEITCFKTHSSL